MRLLLLKQVESVEFTVWDIGGPASMATVNQCFFTDKALYVVVWNLALGEEAVASLQFWLLNIEVRRRQTLRSRAAEPHRGPTTSPKHPPLWVGGGMVREKRWASWRAFGGPRFIGRVEPLKPFSARWLSAPSSFSSTLNLRAHLLPWTQKEDRAPPFTG